MRGKGRIGGIGKIEVSRDLIRAPIRSINLHRETSRSTPVPLCVSVKGHGVLVGWARRRQERRSVRAVQITRRIRSSNMIGPGAGYYAAVQFDSRVLVRPGVRVSTLIVGAVCYV